MYAVHACICLFNDSPLFPPLFPLLFLLALSRIHKIRRWSADFVDTKVLKMNSRLPLGFSTSRESNFALRDEQMLEIDDVVSGEGNGEMVSFVFFSVSSRRFFSFHFICFTLLSPTDPLITHSRARHPSPITLSPISRIFHVHSDLSFISHLSSLNRALTFHLSIALSSFISQSRSHL
jgi:hypothetical protein